MADATTRTERATPTRRDAARRHGAVAVSSEIAPVAVLCAALGLGSWGAPLLVARTCAVLRDWLAAAGPTAAGDGPLSPLAWRTAGGLAGVLGPFFLLVALAGGGAVAVQVGWRPRLERLAPDPRRIGVAAGWTRLGSPDGIASLVQAVVKTALVIGVGWRVLVHVGGGALGASGMAITDVLALAGHGLRELGVVMAAALGAVAGADYAWTRWRHAERLKMSRHELREERKEHEGDPRFRVRFRRAHRELATRGMLADVARADVVLTDPAHVAVAIRYRPGEAGAPRVLAKAGGALGERIAAAARTAGVPLVERRALARALFGAVAIGVEVPQPLHRAVAEALAYVYSRRGGMPGEMGP